MNPTNSSEGKGRAWPRASWPALLALGLASRVLVVGLGMLASPGTPEQWRDLGLPDSVIEKTIRCEAEMATPTRRALIPWYRFDADWYLKVAREGYEYRPDRASSAAFMPLLPMAMAGGSRLGLDIFWAGLVVPNLAFAIGLVGFGRVAARVSGDDGFAWRACLLLIAFPTSFFFSAPYQESLGFALSAWGILAWMDRRPLASAACLGLATTARLACVANSVAIVAEWLDDLIRRREPRRWAWPVAVAGGIGLVGFFLYLGATLGDPLAHLKAHRAWGRKPGLVGVVDFTRQAISYGLTSKAFDLAMVGIVAFFTWRWVAARLSARTIGVLAVVALGLGCWAVLAPAGEPLDGLPRVRDLGRDNLFFFFFLGLGINAWARRGPFWGCLTLVPLALAASSGSPLSMQRVVLSCFPAFLELAELCGKRWSFAAVVVGGLGYQAVLFRRFAHMAFIG